jgi:hypothetical protein
MENNEKPRPAYEPPAVVYEAGLEIRAGSPLGLDDPGPLGLQDPLKLMQG